MHSDHSESVRYSFFGCPSVVIGGGVKGENDESRAQRNELLISTNNPFFFSTYAIYRYNDHWFLMGYYYYYYYYDFFFFRNCWCNIFKIFDWKKFFFISFFCSFFFLLLLVSFIRRLLSGLSFPFFEFFYLRLFFFALKLFLE